MRNLIFALFALLVMAGCGNEDEFMNNYKLEFENGRVGKVEYTTSSGETKTYYNYFVQNKATNPPIEIVSETLLFKCTNGGDHPYIEPPYLYITTYKNGELLRRDTVQIAYNNEWVIITD